MRELDSFALASSSQVRLNIQLQNSFYIFIQLSSHRFFFILPVAFLLFSQTGASQTHNPFPISERERERDGKQGDRSPFPARLLTLFIFIQFAQENFYQLTVNYYVIKEQRPTKGRQCVYTDDQSQYPTTGLSLRDRDSPAGPVGRFESNTETLY